MARPTIDDIWASGGSIIDPGSTKVVTGWASEIPPSEYQNWWQNRADQLLQDIEVHGILSWDAATTYIVGSWAFASDGSVYRSKVDANIGNDPVSSPTQWEDFDTVISINNATTSVKGIVELATTPETQAGTDATRAVTPQGLKDSIQQIVPDASTTTKGKVELATTGETQTGTDNVRAVTPAGLASVTATETRKGLIELATDAEADAGIDTTRAINPKQLEDAKNSAVSEALANVPDASTTVKGKIEIATTAEAQAGTDGVRAITPSGLASVTATETRKGLVERATDAEASAGIDVERYVTPKHLDDLKTLVTVPSATTSIQGKVELANASEVLSGSDGSIAVTPLSLADGLKGINTETGYTRLPGGLIMQWGTTSPINGDSNAWIDSPSLFKIAFPNVCLNVTASLTSTVSSGGPATDPYFAARVKDLTTFQYRTNALSGTHQISYIAIGY